MPRPPHSSWFDHPNNIWWWVDTQKFYHKITYSEFIGSMQCKASTIKVAQLHRSYVKHHINLYPTWVGI
jgi:hypothetical protein